MVMLSPSAPTQANPNPFGNPARGVGKISRDVQELVFDVLRRFYDYSRTLPYVYKLDQAAVMELGVTGQEAFMLKALGPLGRAWERLLSLRTWPEGWNGSDALAPNPAAIVYAVNWILQMFTVVLTSNSQWLQPNITASPDGEVVIEWWHLHRKLTVYITGDGATCLRIWGSNINTEMEEGDIATNSDQQYNWRWLIG